MGGAARNAGPPAAAHRVSEQLVGGAFRQAFLGQIDDFPLVLGLVTIISSAFIAINFVVDIFYSVIDPRVSRET